jgi:PIN domain nuclease of toxin-antitoxin system
MILLDTNALLWLLVGHRRGAPLVATKERLYASPVTLLELKFLAEAGRLRLVRETALEEVSADSRWQLDSPASDLLFRTALEVEWTRDPFDRLIVAHARCRRWRLATGDRRILARLSDRDVLPL